jgi:hypothetical protein
MHEIVIDTDTTGLNPFCNPLVYTFTGGFGPKIITMSAALAE